jgi:hypothetical protein
MSTITERESLLNAEPFSNGHCIMDHPLIDLRPSEALCYE